MQARSNGLNLHGYNTAYIKSYDAYNYVRHRFILRT